MMVFNIMPDRCIAGKEFPGGHADPRMGLGRFVEEKKVLPLPEHEPRTASL
jgi:hypothetical protein